MHHDDGFDARVRGVHATALARLSPTTRAQLQQRRRPATGTRPSPTARLALASVAVCAVAIGLLRLLPDAPPATPARETRLQAAVPTDTLDESPDFYVWLASRDANALAME